MDTTEAPYVTSNMKKAAPDDVACYINRFNTARDADRENRLRGVRNTAAYLNDLVPQHLKAALIEDGRASQSFNILFPIIQGHVGNVLMNWFDPKFVPREDDPIDATEALAKVYLANKEYYNYKASAKTCFENGYVYRGVEMLEVHKPTQNPRTWGIGFKSLRSDHVTFDPNVYSDRIHRDSKEAWITHFLSPKKIIQTFQGPKNDVERDLLLRLQRDEAKALSYDLPTNLLYDMADQARLGSNYRVVEWLHIENERVVRQFLRTGVELPQTGYAIGSMEDTAHKQQWAASFGIELNDDMVFSTQEWKPVLYTTTFCPDLGIVLENRKDFRQLNGHLPLYCWSFVQKNGMSLGLADYLWDILQNFNARQLAKTKIITKSMVGGKPYFREDMFSGDPERLAQAIEDFTDVSKPLVIPEDAPPVPESFGIVRGEQVPPSILQDENFLMLLSERIGMLPPALQGRSERSADTGIAIGRKVIEANVMMKSESDSVVQYENDKATDWVKMAIRLYGHPVNMNRGFQSADGETHVTINEFAGYDPAGNEVIRNNISQLKRVNVIICQTKENDFISQARIEKAIGALQAMPPSESNMLTRASFEYTLATNMDHSTDEERERVKRLADKQLEIVEKNASLTLLNLEMQLQSMQGGAPGGQGGSPEGGSPQGRPVGPDEGGEQQVLPRPQPEGRKDVPDPSRLSQ